MKIVVATRGSKLSLIQTEEFLEKLRKVEPGLQFEIKIVKTVGDVVQDVPLYKIGVKGIFEKEVNAAVLSGEADVAIHSLKDLPSELSSGLAIAGYSPRAPPHDVLVSVVGYSLDTLPKGAVVGTSSVRRAEFLKFVRPDVRVEPLRGNVDTRIRKVLAGQYDAAVMAAAGLLRLYGDTPPLSVKPIRPEIIPPPPGQGIVAAVVREDSWLLDLIKKASDFKTSIEATAEREFLKAVGAGCHVAVGGFATYRGGLIEFTAGYVDGGGRQIVKIYGVDPVEVGRRAALKIRS